MNTFSNLSKNLARAARRRGDPGGSGGTGVEGEVGGRVHGGAGVTSNHGLDLSKVTLTSTGKYHTDVIMAKVGDDLVGGMGMEEEIDVSWFRKPAAVPANASSASSSSGVEMATTEFVRIEGVQSAYYTPSADDIGATVCFRCQDKTNLTNQGFAQIGPLEMEPSVHKGVAEAIEAKRGVFPVTVSMRPGELFQLIFNETSVCVVMMEEKQDDENENRTLDNTIFSSNFADGVSAIIEASSPSALELVAFSLDAGDVTMGYVTSRLVVSATSPRDRDIISIGIRTLRDSYRSALLLPTVASITLREPVGEFGFDDAYDQQGSIKFASNQLRDKTDISTPIDEASPLSQQKQTSLSDVGRLPISTATSASLQFKVSSDEHSLATSSSSSSASAAAAEVRSLRAKVVSLEAELKRADEREADLEASVATSQRARKSMETDLVAMQAERDGARAAVESALGELAEACELAKAAGVKQRKAEAQVKTLEEENGVLQSEIKRAKTGHAEARKARQVRKTLFIGTLVTQNIENYTHMSHSYSPHTMTPHHNNLLS